MNKFELLKSLNEVSQTSMFDSDDQKPKHKYIVTPMGVGYDDLSHAKAVADKNSGKKAKVVDTASGECVYNGSAK